VNQEKVLKVLLGPIVSEKTTMASASNQYVFKVRTDSNKREIRAAVESMFGVKVEAVTTSNVKGKKKVFKGKLVNALIGKKR
jgi:large subunit ribosomal protein L23